MAFDGVTVAAIVSELNNKLADGRIAKVAQPEKDELMLTIKTPNGQNRLVLSANPTLPLVYLTDENKISPATAPSFTMLLRKHIQGGRICSISQPDFERIIVIEVEHLDEMGDLCRKRLITELMGKYSNIILVDEKDMITGQELAEGDVLVGIASSGIHSNGYSLVRKVFEMSPEALNVYYDALDAKLGEVLLRPTKIYVKALRSVKDAGVRIKACSHITGGGFYENVPRMLKDGMHAVIHTDSYPIPPIFRLLAKEGEIEEQMMYNTFNMGIGMILAVKPEDVEAAMKAIRKAGEYPYEIGTIISGEKGVTLD